MRSQHQSYTLADIADRFGCLLNGSSDILVNTVGTLENGTPNAISFLANPLYRKQLSSTRAGAVVISSDEAARCPVPTLVSENAYAAYARIADFLCPQNAPQPGVHTTAVVVEGSEIPKSCQIEANVVVGEGSHLGDGVVIGPGCLIGTNVRIGKGSRLVGHVTVLDNVVIGKRALIHPGAVLGSDGFGFALDNGRWIKVPQIGNVIIGDDVEIGANTTIDRGTIDDTIIENGVKLDNQIQIAHNVQVGEHTVIAGLTGVAGSTKIGKCCVIGGSVGIIGHLNIDDEVKINACSLITKSLKGPGTYSGGLPAEEVSRWRKQVVFFRKLAKRKSKKKTED